MKEEVVRLLQSALVTLLLGAGFLSQPSPAYRVEREPVADGAELVTVFGRLYDPASGSQDLDVPLLSVLRDSLGDSDPANDRLRQSLDTDQHTAHAVAARRLRAFVWIFSRWKQEPRQSGSVAHSGLGLALPKRVQQFVQRRAAGAGIRSAGRGHSIHHAHLSRTIRAIITSCRYSRLSPLWTIWSAIPASLSILPDSQLREIYSRLSLSTRAFGGLVREQQLSKYYDKETSQLPRDARPQLGVASPARRTQRPDF